MAEGKTYIVVLGTYATKGEALRRRDALLAQGFNKVLIAYIAKQRVYIVYQVVVDEGGNGTGRSNRK